MFFFFCFFPLERKILFIEFHLLEDLLGTMNLELEPKVKTTFFAIS